MSMTETAVGIQYLTCTLGDEVFALEIDKVREVLDFPTVTKIPRTPEFVRGVINLRGAVVPVIDLRVQFGMSPTERTVNTCVIILEVIVDGDTVVVGALADSVREVVELSREEMEPAPRIGSRLRTEFIKAIGKSGGTMLIVLDMNKVFSSEDLLDLEKCDLAGRPE
jgi:purine-binding chemotaxis protein CheW